MSMHSCPQRAVCGSIALLAMLVLVAGTAMFADAEQPSPGYPTGDKSSKPGKAGFPIDPGEFTIVIEGSKQGRFKGDGVKADSGKSSDDGFIIGVDYSHEVKLPASGGAGGTGGGKRAHEPIVVTKAWGPSSPQLLTAIAAGEKLKHVWLQFYRSPGGSGGRGAPEVYYTITLTNAELESVRSFIKDDRQLEEFALRFERIDVEHTPSKTTGTDTGR